MYGLKYKILLLTLIPLVFVLLAIDGLSIYNKYQTERQLLSERLNTYRTLLESGDLTFDTAQDKTKIEAIRNEKVEFTEILDPNHTVLYTTENSAAPLMINDEKKEIDEAFQGIEITRNIQKNGKSVFVIISPLIVNGKVVAVIHQGLSNAESSQRVWQYAIYITILTLIGIIICFVLISILLSEAVLRNINKLKEATIKMQKGDLSVIADVSSKDEIGELATSFNQMAAELKSYYGELEQKVAERTSEAEEAKTKLESQVGELESNKSAMLNLLEDAKELEKQLEIEKESVEKKVLERTRQLNEEKIKLAASISSLTLGFIMTDRANNIVTINQAAKNILCASANSPLATVQNCTLSHIEDELRGAIDLRALINRSVVEKKVLLIKELEFQGRFLKIVITPIMELADVIGCVVLVDDITEAKILERSKDEFFSIASHELRTPLTAIKGNTSMIEEFYADKIKDPELRDMISDIHESSVRLIEIVNDFLDTSRLEQGKMEFKKAPIDLVNLITSVIKEYQVTGSRKKLAIEFHPDEKVALPKVFADPDKTKQVLINLIGNGLKFTEQGGVTITTQVLPGFVKVLVTDTGRGISKTNQSLLFHKFQQANTSLLTRDTTKGTGLGLYISKLIIEGMGGEIKLESSTEGKGTTFSLTLPTATKEEQLAGPKILINQTKVESVTGLKKNSAPIPTPAKIKT